jgi:sRNA-binding regulator protein Hfq
VACVSPKLRNIFQDLDLYFNHLKINTHVIYIFLSSGAGLEEHVKRMSGTMEASRDEGRLVKFFFVAGLRLVAVVEGNVKPELQIPEGLWLLVLLVVLNPKSVVFIENKWYHRSPERRREAGLVFLRRWIEVDCAVRIGFAGGIGSKKCSFYRE